MTENLVVHDKRFSALTLPNAFLEKLHGGMKWAEGPVYFPHGDFILWSDIPNNQMLQWVEGLGTRVFRTEANNSNGNTRDLEGRLVTCEHLTRRVTRTEHDGTITVVADSHDGKRLNSPNDVVVKSDGTIWFTDPPYGILSDYEGRKAEQEQNGCYVFRFDPADGNLAVVADDFVKPNGLAFSPDESRLCISDTGRSHDPDGPHHIRMFDVSDDNLLSNARVFAEIDPGVSDGFRFDIQGNLWTSADNGVQCFSGSGDMLGEILTGETVANVTFGGPRNNRLFITATTSLFSMYVAVPGAR